MAYLGNAPARSFISFERQVFTIVNSQTVYTLSHSVTNENDIRLVVNNVVQEPGSGKAYTASGTTLTLSAALTNGTDEMYCVFLGRAVGTVNAPAGSVDTAQLAADAVTNAKVDSSVITGQTAETSIATDDLILLSDTSASGALRKMTRANFVSGVGGTNECIWFASLTSDQTISHNSNTKVAFSNEVIDTASAYDPTTNYRFTVPSGKGGTYRVDFGFWCYDGSSNLQQVIGYLYKNGTDLFNIRGQHDASGEYAGYVNISSVITLSAGDYLEVYCYGQESSSGTFVISGSGNSAKFRNFFSGYKLIT